MSFVAAVKEAVKAFELWSQVVSEKEQLEIEKNAKKPPPYKHIKVTIISLHHHNKFFNFLTRTLMSTSVATIRQKVADVVARG